MDLDPSEISKGEATDAASCMGRAGAEVKRKTAAKDGAARGKTPAATAAASPSYTASTSSSAAQTAAAASESSNTAATAT